MTRVFEVGQYRQASIFSETQKVRRQGVLQFSLILSCMMAMLMPANGEEATKAVGSFTAAQAKRAFIDGTGQGWKALQKDDFVNVNCEPDTFTWEGSIAHCKGKPIGVIRTRDQYKNFELVVEWKHLKPAGNSGIFLWADEQSIDETPPNDVPKGIEVQVLENNYPEFYTKQTGKKADWFTTHGDVFPVHGALMKPFEPIAPDGIRSFPTKQLSMPAGNWNHYYIRAINGEVRLWVNGEEVSGGSDCEPRHGYLALESEGSPVDFRNIRIRPLP